MKKIGAAIIILTACLAAGVPAWAGIFNDYWDFEEPGEIHSYGFPRIKVSMDQTWYRKTRVVLSEDGSTASFCHKDSYNAYAEEGLTGGILFTLCASENTDFEDLPDVVYLDFDEEEALYYYALLPTDYQAYTDDENIRAEYDELRDGVEDVLDTAIVKGSEKFRKLQAETEADTEAGPEGAPGGIISAAEYDYRINEDKETITLVMYTGDKEAVKIPSEIDGYRVTEIGAEAFRYRKLKSVTFPETIQRIGKQAFEYCTISDRLLLPENAVIMDNAFSYAVLPAEVTIPAGTTVEACAFSYCEELAYLFIDSGVKIQNRGFEYCDDLAAVICADDSRLETKAFGYCRDLMKVILCGSAEMQEDAFNNCGDPKTEAAQGGEYDTLKAAATDGSLPEIAGTSSDDGAERELEIRNNPVSQDGVTVTLDTATAKSDKSGFEYTFSGTIENTSDEGIMQVIYTFALIDENGEEFRSFGEVYDGEDTALAAHTRIDFSHDGIKWGKQSVPAAVEIGISSVKTEEELPPEHVPQKGEYLYLALGDEKLARIKEEPPVELSFHVDQGGYGRTATFTEGDALDWAVELLCEIRIGEESGEWVTDNYNGIYLTWADGSHTGISLNLSNLEHTVHSSLHTYELEHLDEFWSFAADYLTEDE